MYTKGASRLVVILATSVVFLVGAGAYVWHESVRPPVLEIFIFGIPGNPAIFLRTPTDKRILIDGGSNSEVVKHLTDVLPFYSRHIDTVIATLPSGKNVTGLIDVLSRYKVDKVFGMASSTDTIYGAFLGVAHEARIEIQEPKVGDTIPVDKDVSLAVLFPAPPETFDYSKASPPEIILKIVHGENSILLAGHASTKVQRFLVSGKSHIANKPGKVDALVVSHSALPTSFAYDFFASTSPDYLVYSKQVAKSAAHKKPTKKSAAKTTTKIKKQKPDPTAGILEADRYNIRESGVVKIVSDGVGIKINQ